MTLPELGTRRAKHRPLTFLTSNRTREIHDALKRRCVYQWIDYPSPDRELAIVRAKVPGVGERLAGDTDRVRGATATELVERTVRAESAQKPAQEPEGVVAR